MPFTLAHPAAVLPLRRMGLPLSALVVGSMAPDFEYLIRLEPRSVISHTVPGLALFCVPVGLLVLVIWHRVWCQPLLALWDPRDGAREATPGPVFTFWPLGRLLLLAAAVLLGAATHLGWDAFTHEHGWVVEHVPPLAQPAFTTAWGSIAVFKLLQHGSTLAGLGVLVAYLRSDLAFRPALRVSRPRALGTAVTGCGFVGALAGLAHARGPGVLAYARQFAGTAVLAAFAAGVVTLTVYSLAWRARQRPAPSGKTDS